MHGNARWRLGTASAVVCVVAMAAAVGAGATPPTSAAGQHVCEASGGTFLSFAPSYGCIGGTEISYREETTAAKVCEHAYRGTFVVRPTGYICQI